MKKQMDWPEATTYHHWLENFDNALKNYEQQHRYKTGNRLRTARGLRDILTKHQAEDPEHAAKSIKDYLEANPIKKWGFWGPLKNFIEKRLYNHKKVFNRNQQSYMYKFRKIALATYNQDLFQTNYIKLRQLEEAHHIQKQEEQTTLLQKQIVTLQTRIQELETNQLTLLQDAQETKEKFEIAEQRIVKFNLQKDLLVRDQKIQSLENIKNINEEYIKELSKQLDELKTRLQKEHEDLSYSNEKLVLLAKTAKEKQELENERQTLCSTIQNQAERYTNLEKKYHLLDNKLQEQTQLLHAANEKSAAQQKQLVDQFTTKLTESQKQLEAALKENNDLKEKNSNYLEYKNKINGLEASKSSLEQDRRNLKSLLLHVKVFFSKYFSAEKTVYEISPTQVELNTIKTILNTECEATENNSPLNTMLKSLSAITKNSR